MENNANKLPINRSVLEAMVIPELAYEDVRQAVEWLCGAFGFAERLRIGNHRAQLILGSGAVIVTQRSVSSESRSSVLVRVADVEAHYQQAQQYGAKILQPPTDFPYGERQYNAEDLGGHRWTFSQSIADVDPASWGGVLFDPNA